ncbi:hypothetical protein GB928_028615 [Shinella curvata]|uniref:Uncharacterized protein n=1 Tax=Shinella curvata TaxID=1817964 RepID=A0ABT8XP52_9HYPH|nr:hypothetical protein [Shinella curvata]MCJ8056148.1 hypothetical protein [Shinella curvata]MDO6125149.1 hypothetical protein [Shinella curvata]
MTDIRRHGFESDAQWREHLEEIEDAVHPIGDLPPSDQNVLEHLAAMRVDVAALRELVEARRQGNPTRGWRSLVGLAALLMFVVAVGR